MTKIEAKVFLKIWDRIAQLEHKTDRGLSLRIGITPSAVTHWRSGRTSHVMPIVLDRLEKKLGYTVDFKEDGSLKLHKIGEASHTDNAREARLILRRDPRSRESLAWPLATKPTIDVKGLQFGESGNFSPVAEHDLTRNIWLQMEDDSMSPLVPKGSWLLVQQNAKPETGEIGVIAAKTIDAPVIGIVTIEDKRFLVEPTNGKLMSFKPEQILSSYRVLAVVFPRGSERMSLEEGRMSNRAHLLLESR